MNITLKEVLMSFTKAIDVYNYLLKNHHRRTAIIAYQIGKEYKLSEERLSNLVIAAALHDIGALTIEERDKLIEMDVKDPFPHCNLGCYMLESFAPFSQISKIIYYHHKHYDDRDGLYKGEVPVESFLLHIADRTDILIEPAQPVLMQRKRIVDKINSYSGTVFHPKLVEAFVKATKSDFFWLNIDNMDLDTIMERSVSHRFDIEMTLPLLEQFAYTISKIIDCRSSFTISHSFGVSEVTLLLCKYMGYSEEKCCKMKVAGLLHDMGKVAVATEIIEKKGLLSKKEKMNVQTHAYYTNLILESMRGLEEIAEWASSHHENHDGTGYPRKLHTGHISEEMDIIAYADIYTALSEERPYRKEMSRKQILGILQNQFVVKHGDKVFQVIREHQVEIDEICKKSVKEGIHCFLVYKALESGTG